MSASAQESTSSLFSVREICEELCCRDAAAAAAAASPVFVLERLQRLHSALLKEKVDAYDPSTVFLALRAAALRFLPSSSSSESEQELSLRWSITEEALLAAAALACVCVGPLWYAQRRRTRRFHPLPARHTMSTTSTTTSIDDGSTLQSSTMDSPPPSPEQEQAMQQVAGGSWSISPNDIDPETTGSSSSNTSARIEELNRGEDTTSAGTLIPEALPAALLRHAQSLLQLLADKTQTKDSKIWDQRRTRIAIGQRHLVLALCFEGSDLVEGAGYQLPSSSNNNETITRQWTIPGARKPVGEMILYWLSLAAPADSPSVKLQFSNNVESDAKRCCLRSKWLDAWTASHADQWYVLAVSRAIVDLISTGWRPIPKEIGLTVIQLLVRIAWIGISNLDTLWDEESRATDDSPLFPRTKAWLTALSSSAEAVSALAAMGSSSLIHHDAERDLVVSICYIHVRTRLVKLSLLAQQGETLSTRGFPIAAAEREQCLYQIDSCFADTWELLVALCISTSCHGPLQGLLEVISISNPRSNPSDRFSTEQWGTREKLDCLASGTALRVLSAAIWETPQGGNIPASLRNQVSKQLGTIREIAASIHEILHDRINDGSFERKSTFDLLSFALDTVVALGNFCNQQILGGGELISTVEWDIFFISLEEAFLPWQEYDSIIKTLEDDGLTEPTRYSHDIRKVLKRSNIEAQSLILRVGALLDRFTRDDGTPFHSIVVYESQTRLYKFMLKKVIPAIDPTDGELLGLSVSRAWVKFGMFPFRVLGWFDTASEILKELFHLKGDGHFVFSPSVRLAALVALENTSRQPFLPSNGQKNHSSQTRHVLQGLADASDYHAEIIKAMLDTVETNLKALLLVRREDNPDPDTPICHPNKACVALNSHLVRVAGKFLCHESVNRDRKLKFLALLESLAMMPPPSHDGSNDEKTNQKASLAELFIQLEAVSELEQCIEVSFARAPVATASWIVPVVMESFCRILTALHSDDRMRMDAPLSIRVSMYVVLILARVRQSYQGKWIILFDREKALGDIPDDIKPELEISRQAGRRSLPSLASMSTSTDSQGSTHTGVMYARMSCSSTFIEITQSLLAHICASRRLLLGAMKDPQITTLLRFSVVLCYHIIASHWQSGVPLGGKDARMMFLSSCSSKNEDLYEAVFASKTLGVFIECRVPELRTFFSQTLPFTDGPEEFELLLECALGSFDQDRHVIERVIVARSLLVTLPTVALVNEGATFLSSLFSCLVDVLKNQIAGGSVTLGDDTNAAKASTREEDTFINLGLAYELVYQNPTTMPTPDVIKLFGVCVTMTGASHLDHYSPVFHLALRCLSTIIEILPVNNVAILKKNLLDDFPHIRGNYSHDKQATLPLEDDSFLWRRFIPRFVWDICDQRLRCAAHPEAFPSSFDTSEIKQGFSFLDVLAIEIDQLEKFDVEIFDQTGTPMISSWYDEGYHLLTLRVGSSKSPFRGWVEMVIRSPSKRARRICRLPFRTSLHDPHGASSLWAPQQVVYLDPSTCLKLPPNHSLNFNNQKLQTDYESLISRFDGLMSPIITDIHGDSPEAETALDPQNSSLFAENDKDPGILFEASQTQDVSENIEQWLIRSLGDDESANTVLLGIEELGFAHFSKTFTPDVSLKPQGKRNFLKQLRPGQKTNRSITVLDRTTPCNTHKIGLLYAGPSRIGSESTFTETELLSNQHCSPAFYKFADGLGTMVLTKNLRFFSGGLDVSAFECDGHFARVWVDEAPGDMNLHVARTIVVYHVPSLMPPGVNTRKRHIGNDLVQIVFHEKSFDGVCRSACEEVNPFNETESVVSGHFNFVTIHVNCMSRSIFARVTVRLRQGLPDGLRRALIHFVGTSIIHIDDTPSFVRRMAIQADLVCHSMLDNLAPASNAYERFKMLTLMQRHIIA